MKNVRSTFLEELPEPSVLEIIIKNEEMDHEIRNTKQNRHNPYSTAVRTIKAHNNSSLYCTGELPQRPERDEKKKSRGSEWMSSRPADVSARRPRYCGQQWPIPTEVGIGPRFIADLARGDFGFT